MVSQPGDHDMNELSQRRADMRRELLGELKQYHEKRRRTRQVASVLVLMIGAALSIVLATAIQPARQERIALEQPVPQIELPMETIEPPQNRLIEVQYIATRPGAAQRYLAKGSNLVVWIDDRELLNALVAINRPSGLIHSEGQVWLTESVTDEFDQ